ncbi:hypothetical protein ASG73_01635 [Janibacter sp. Soil728]|uniref:hypothetical protein n=1 Tax=Janibacter sp. Soil728 TaxID=1736393 RepID=UPI0006FFCF00|nr:hypothetical protein [Janibacter sp. Soil728]KRE39082.1 hypothetical protein ASG73_01635 [Janibacter sp. Soil728]
MARQTSTDERDSVHGVNPGTELGRYTVESRIEEIPGGERWAARDTTLDRDVTLLVMPADADTTAAALDAARRAAGVEAAQLVRILDVGGEGDLAWIAEDALDGARTYAAAIGTDGLPAEEVRRITGEVATGVEAARARGLHHLALTPEIVQLTSDGRVKVRGLATTAALAGIETEGAEADRDDALSIVALAYAGLTATWPLETTTTLPAAPRTHGRATPPSHVAVAVPGDLDTICRETLTEGTGPDSPGDYAAQIAPWSRIPLAGAVRTSPTSADEAPTEVFSVSAAGAATTVAATGTDTGTDTDTDEDADQVTRPVTLDDDGRHTVVITPGGRATSSQTSPAAASQDPTEGADEERDIADDDHHDRKVGASAAAAAAAAAAGAVGTGGKVIGDRLGKAARTAGGRSKEAIHDVRARREAIRADQRTRTSLGSAPATAEIESPAPLLPAEAGAPPSRGQANLVMMIMAGFVVLACLLGVFGTSRIGSSTDLGKILGGDETTAVQTSEPSSDAGGNGTGEPLGIINAAGFDPPPGDGAEHNAEVPRVYDGDPSTIWTTEGYNSESFGGVKQGVGITVDLGQTQKISSVTLDLPTTSRATVYAGDQATNSGTEVGKTEGRTGTVVLTPSSEVTGQFVTVWFTSLAPSDDGRYRAVLGEIAVR